MAVMTRKRKARSMSSDSDDVKPSKSPKSPRLRLIYTPPSSVRSESGSEDTQSTKLKSPKTPRLRLIHTPPSSNVSSDSEDVKSTKLKSLKIPRLSLVYTPTKSKPVPSFLTSQKLTKITLKSPTGTSTTIPIHKAFITHTSPFFASHFQTEDELVVANIAPEIFEIFVGWVYTGSIHSWDSENGNREEINTLINLYLLAEHFLVSKLQEQIMSLLLEDQFKGYIFRETVWDVFEKSQKGSSMRGFLRRIRDRMGEGEV